MLQQLLKNYFLACASVLNGCSVRSYFAYMKKEVYTKHLTCEGSLNILTMTSHIYWNLALSEASEPEVLIPQLVGF